MTYLSIATTLVIQALGGLVGYLFFRAYLSPARNVPGPKLAALTKWYEAYYEIALKGKFSAHIDDLHRKYGPIVRITPEEVHIKDPTFWDTLYVKQTKAARYEWTAGRFGNSSSLLTTSDPALHKLRRSPLNNMFSRRAIIGFEPVVQQKMRLLRKGLIDIHERDVVCNMTNAFTAFAGDVIMNYCFGFDYGHVVSRDFDDSFHEAFVGATTFGHTALQFPWMHTLVNMLPPSWSKAMNPPLAKLIDLQRDLRDQISSVRLDFKARNNEDEAAPERPTIFDALLQSTLPDTEKTTLRLAEEAQLLIGAGLLTTAWTLSQATFYILANHTILSALRTELWHAIPDSAAPDAFDYARLENLPYLRGCVKEAIRMSLGVSARNPRVLSEPLVYRDHASQKDWVIAAGTPVSMTNTDVLLNDECFPDAKKFVPERWAGENPKAPDGSPLERYFVAFGKGTRMCLGINLAYMELFVMLGTLFRTYDLELFETDESDVLLCHDFFTPFPKLDSKGVRVKVTGVVGK